MAIRIRPLASLHADESPRGLEDTVVRLLAVFAARLAAPLVLELALGLGPGHHLERQCSRTVRTTKCIPRGNTFCCSTERCLHVTIDGAQDTKAPTSYHARLSQLLISATNCSADGSESATTATPRYAMLALFASIPCCRRLICARRPPSQSVARHRCGG